MNFSRAFLMLTLIAVLTFQMANFDIDRWQKLTQVRLIVPRANVNTPVTRFYLGSESWEIPSWEERVGHLVGTAWLNHIGNIVLGGHAEYPDGSPAVFEELSKVRVGDSVLLKLGGVKRSYRVVETRLVDYNDLRVLYPSTTDRLTLITCDEASYDHATQTYSKRLIVIAERED